MTRGRGWLRLWLWGSIDQQKSGVGAIVMEVGGNGEE